MNDLQKYNLFLSSSKQFNIPTKEIMQLQDTIDKWMESNSPGGIIYGRPRIGKTSAIRYITKNLRMKYGDDLPVIVFNSSAHIPSEGQFYSEMLSCMKNPYAFKGNIAQKKQRCVNELLSMSLNTPYHRIILFIDEAFNFTEKDFSWLMFIHNELDYNDVKLTVFLVGTAELKALKQAYIHAKKQQIVGRFMTNEFEFHGIRNEADIQICLLNYDTPKEYSYFSEKSMTEVFFPKAYEDSYRLSKQARMIMEIFTEVMQENEIDLSSDIPMQYFISTINNCLKTYGVFGHDIYFPEKEHWKDAINRSGYADGERCGLL